MEPTLDQKLARMQTILRELESVAVAFSAGVDSTLVLKIALDTLGPTNVVAVTGRSDSLARDEFTQAVELASAVGAEHVVLDTDEFQNPNYTSNPTNRCYFCKTTLYDHMARLLRDRGLRHIVNGINVDDLGDYRPGIQAAKEHAVRCPAAEAGLTKADVRELSQRLGLPTFDKPASPCLSSRVPYGQSVTPEKLRMIEAAEKFLHSLGIRECRVRHYESEPRTFVRADTRESEAPAEPNQHREGEADAPAEPTGGMAKRSTAMQEQSPTLYRDRQGAGRESEAPAEPNQYRDRKGAVLAAENGAYEFNSGGHSARIEVPVDSLPFVTSLEMSSRITEYFHSLGYSEITFDPRGFRSGSLNDAILLNIAART